jgi:hypothetical protein
METHSLFDILGEDIISRQEEIQEETLETDVYDELEDPFFTKNVLKSITDTHSTNIAENFEQNELEKFIWDTMEELYSDDEISKKSSKEIIKNDDYVNSMFIQLLKRLVSKNLNKYSTLPNKYGIIFVCFAEYFGLDYDTLYQKMHQKIQNSIKKSLIGIIGKDTFNMYLQKAQSTSDNSETEPKFIKLWEL